VGQSKEFGGSLLSHWIKPLSDQVYQVERNLHLLRSVGLPVRSDELELQVPLEARRSVDALLARAGIEPGQAFVALAPGASAAARRYPEERFAEAAARLADESGLPVVLIGSPREQGKFPRLEAAAARQPLAAAPTATAAAGENAPRLVSLIGQTSLPEMAAVIQRSALLIGNNSGSMHIAAALNRPMVILFAGTELFEQWVPHRENALMLNQPTPCAPCHGFQCPYHLECLDISAEGLAASALKQLKTYAFPAPNQSATLAGSLRR
jgi:ADP-heptose:LPS heptosyltransferase